MKKSSGRKKGASQGKDAALGIQERICLWAYDLYERRGCRHGHDVEDWLQAEREVLIEVADEVLEGGKDKDAPQGT